MSSDRVNDDFDDELLSAYVDGELTAEERAAVEARLQGDPRAARLVTELRSLSKAINSLPRETLGEDLRLRVQAEIEEARSAAAAEVLPMTPPYDRWNGLRRGLWWSAAAIAATVALVMMTPKNATRKERDIAQREEEVGHPSAKANKKLADDEVPPGLAGSMRAMNGPKPALAPAAGVQPPGPADQSRPATSEET
jgi:anti-sigma factor RsiW